ncbi:uncharacterized protein LOC124805025 [Schistocerca piceifrons]|uniref:uncharacterized protein LOC124805025 n=1 Tax=Schistocerca piceifrons TaxID=274613 RepID=UPI001F5E4DD5|nr:uncharacterized protein LOC124805025 [Schistocerca piceifrons]
MDVEKNLLWLPINLAVRQAEAPLTTAPRRERAAGAAGGGGGGGEQRERFVRSRSRESGAPRRRLPKTLRRLSLPVFGARRRSSSASSQQQKLDELQEDGAEEYQLRSGGGGEMRRRRGAPRAGAARCASSVSWRVPRAPALDERAARTVAAPRVQCPASGAKRSAPAPAAAPAAAAPVWRGGRQ